MLYLLHELSEHNIFFNLFRYITLRTAGGAITAFLVSMLLGPWLIRKLSSMSISENVEKGDSPDLYRLHRSKKGTPTMGGLIILLSITISTFLWADICSAYVVLALLVVTALGAVGALDDLIKLRSEAKGLTITQKLLLQAVVSLAVALALWSFLRIEKWGTDLQFPFLNR